MAIVDLVYRTITCNGPDCKNTVTFEQKDIKKAVDETPWMKTLRILQTADGRNLSYCCDVCEVKGVGTETHNAPEEKKVIETPSASATEQIQRAAKEAQDREAATQALKTGKPVKLHTK